jgi:Helix-turn-helix domain
MATSRQRQVLVDAGVRPLWDSPTTAAFLDVPLATLDQWAYKGVGPAFSKIGRHRRYRPRDVEAYIDANRHEGAAA